MAVAVVAALVGTVEVAALAAHVILLERQLLDLLEEMDLEEVLEVEVEEPVS